MAVYKHVIDENTTLAQHMTRYVVDNRMTYSRDVLGYITKAAQKDSLKRSVGTMSLREFIEAAEFPIEKANVDKFFNGMRHDMMVLVDDDTMSWMGYAGDAAWKRRKEFKKDLKRTDPDGTTSRELGFDDLNQFRHELLTSSTLLISDGLAIDEKSNPSEPLMMPTKEEIIKSYPVQPKTNQSSQQKFYLLKPKTLKKIMMSLKTKKGDEVRDYFVTLEELVMIYDTYQQAYNGVTLNNKCLKLKRANRILDIQNDLLSANITEQEQNGVIMCRALMQSRDALSTARSEVHELKKQIRDMEARVYEVEDLNEELTRESTSLKESVKTLAKENDKLNDELVDMYQTIESYSDDETDDEQFASLATALKNQTLEIAKVTDTETELNG